MFGITVIQGYSNSTATIGISETIRDTRMDKLGQSCVFRCLAICRLESLKLLTTSGDIREKPKIFYFVFIFFWHYFKTYEKIGRTFLLPLFALKKITFTDFQYAVSLLKHHHQLYFFKYGTVFFMLDFKCFSLPISVMYDTCP